MKLHSFTRSRLLRTLPLMMALSAVSTLTFAEEEKKAEAKVPSVSSEVSKAITDNLAKARPELAIESIKASPIEGLYRVSIGSGPALFISADGNYMLAADMYQINEDGFVNLQEKEREAMRKEVVSGLDVGDMIVYKPEGETKGVINVFTDVDCGYCQKLHREIPKLQELGIELRYMAYPRAGINSESYRKIASAWCAKDRNAAMDKLKSREPIKMDVCKDNPVKAHLALGNQVGVRGTPAILLEDGTMLPGYLPAAELANRLGIEVEAKEKKKS